MSRKERRGYWRERNPCNDVSPVRQKGGIPDRNLTQGTDIGISTRHEESGDL